MSKEQTGYPSLDKPQLKYYRDEPVRQINTEQTIYNLIFSTNENNLDSMAIEYLGVEWTFEKLKSETDKAASAFYYSGLRKEDTVLIGVSNCPELVVTLLALNKIGVVSKWFDVRASEKDIEEYANQSKCRYIIAFDMLIPKIQNVLNDTAIEKVIIITPADSLSKIKQVGYAAKAKLSIPKDSRYYRFYSFIRSYEGDIIECVGFDRNRPSVMIQSSGTTGKPKVIVHSDYSASSCARSLAYSDLPLGKNKILLNLLPPWIAYALGEAILYPLAMGSKVMLCPTFDPDAIMPYIGKFTVSMAAPFHYRYLYDHLDELSNKKKKLLYDTVESFISGGDKISVEENARFETKFKTVLVNGYGNNEGWGCLTVNSVLNNRYGSVGLPKYDETVIAYDNENEKELPYNTAGEICALANTMFINYEGNENDTDSVRRLHPDGKIWLHTGDLGIIDEDGFIFLQGRLRRVIVRLGFKISAYTIEDKISEHPYVKECVAVEVEDKDEEHVPMVFVMVIDDLADTEEEIIESILNKCRNELKEYEVPKHIKVVDSLPYTQNGKYDFRALEKIGNDYVNHIQ